MRITSALLAAVAFLGAMIFGSMTCQSIMAKEAAKSSLQPARLTVEYTVAPLGIQTDRPMLGWNFTAAGCDQKQQRDQKQTAYRILIADNADTLKKDEGNVWDSGKLQSDRSVSVPYGGKPLKSRSAYHWKVQTWDAVGLASDWSKPDVFEVGLLQKADWSAKWIGMKTMKKTEKKISPLLRKEFTLDSPVRKARAYFSGLGFSELYLNGKKISDAVLSPTMGDYHVEAPYRILDLTADLQQGKNAIGLWLGNGWYSAGIPMNERPWANSPEAIVQLEIETQDGKTVVIRSDETWKMTTSPISMNALHEGEYYDARDEKPGWNTVGYDDSAWKNVDRTNGPKGKLIVRTLADMKVMKRFQPVKVENPKKGVWVFHFDKLCAGWAELHVRGKAGQTIQLDYSPRLLPDGTIDKIQCPGSEDRDRYTLGGDTNGETFAPRFVFHPLRYVQVVGLEDKPDMGTLTGCHVYTGAPLDATFECSNPLFNDIERIVQQTVANAMKGFLLDCLHREIIGYNEPASVGATLWSRNHMPQFWLKNAHDVYLASVISGFPSDITPLCSNYHGRARKPDVSQSASYPMVIWDTYLLFDDRRVLEEHYDIVKNWLKFVHEKMCKDGRMVTEGWLGDHMLPGKGPGYEQWASTETTRSHIWTSFYAENAEIAGKIADVLGEKDEAATFHKEAEELKKTVNEKWYNADQGSYDTGSQTANFLPLALGLVPEKEIPRVAESLRKKLAENDYKLRVGHAGLPAMMEASVQYGLGETLYKAINHTEYPGWGYMLSKGATTVWECWGQDWADLKEKRRREDSMTMLGCVVRFFYDDLAGIRGPDYYGHRPFAPGYKEITIAPHVLGDLTYAKASIQTVRGPIRSEWKRMSDSFQLEVDIPANAVAEVRIPTLGWTNFALQEGERTIVVNGKPTGITGVHSAKQTEDAVVCQIGSGTYRFILTRAR